MSNGKYEQYARKVCIAVCQFSCTDDVETNLKRAEDMVTAAAAEGANVVLLQELFAGRYFPIDQMDCTDLAISWDKRGTSFIERFRRLAKTLDVVLPVSFFERCNNVYYNSVVMIDSNGDELGVYRKSHIPDGPGYQEKFYFTPGHTGFHVFHTRVAAIGVAICWDQWFPEVARSLVLRGAEMLLFPTAIGSEPHDSAIQSRPHWQRVMQGHAAANMVPVAAANRIGVEKAKTIKQHAIAFYGSSFITDHTGLIVAQASENKSGLVKASFDLDNIQRERSLWGLFRDRRPELYNAITTMDGHTQVDTDKKQ